MRKITLAFCAIVLCYSAFADDKSHVLLVELQKKVSSWGDYRVEFSVSIGGSTLTGSYEVSGENYHLTTPEMELFCDGTTKWEVNRLDREVTIDRVDPTDRTVLGNPTRLFDFLDGSYTHRYVGAALIGGANCERIELNDSAVGTGQTIDVFVSTATGLPVRVGYTMGLMNADAAIDVVRITPRVTLNRTAFTYDSKRYVGYEMIDFR